MNIRLFFLDNSHRKGYILPNLSKILNELAVVESFFSYEVMTSPWTVKLTHKGMATFHCLLSDSCRLSFGGKEYLLDPGDAVIAIKSPNHFLECGNNQIQLKHRHDSKLLYGYFSFGKELPSPLFEAFPPMVILSNDEISRDPWLKKHMEFLLNEAHNRYPGMPHILNRMTEILLVLSLRHIVKVNEVPNGFLKAAFDSQIGTALNKLHTNPAENWTVEKVAKELGMSRSSFSNRFTKLVGSPFGTYLTGVRMRKAARLLRKTDFSIVKISTLVGYCSDVSFNRVFKKFTGQTAISYRKKFRNNNVLDTHTTKNSSVLIQLRTDKRNREVVDV